MSRRWLGVVAVLALAGCDRGSTVAPGGDPSHAGARHGAWLRLEGKHEGKPIVWELRERYAVKAPRGQLLTVTWHYVSRRADGQPDEAQLAGFAAAEKRLTAALDAQADLVATVDFDGQHGWYWYAGDAGVEATARAAIPADAARHFTLGVEPDVAAEFYRGLAAKVP